MTPTTIKSGFRATGIIAIDVNVSIEADCVETVEQTPKLSTSGSGHVSVQCFDFACPCDAKEAIESRLHIHENLNADLSGRSFQLKEDSG